MSHTRQPHTRSGAQAIHVAQLAAAERRGRDLAAHAFATYRTRDPHELAACVNVKVAYRRWALITVGEYDSRLSTITVNLAALGHARHNEPHFTPGAIARIIIAHELGHFFDHHIASSNCVINHAQREIMVHVFAGQLLNITIDVRAYNSLWLMPEQSQPILMGG